MVGWRNGHLVAVGPDLQCKLNVNFRQNLMQIVTCGKRAQTKVDCLSSASCVVSWLCASVFGVLVRGWRRPRAHLSRPHLCRCPVSSHGLQGWWGLRCNCGTRWLRRVLFPLLPTHLLLSAYAPLCEAKQRGGNHVLGHVEPRIENP